MPRPSPPCRPLPLGQPSGWTRIRRRRRPRGCPRAGPWGAVQWSWAAGRRPARPATRKLARPGRQWWHCGLGTVGGAWVAAAAGWLRPAPGLAPDGRLPPRRPAKECCCGRVALSQQELARRGCASLLGRVKPSERAHANRILAALVYWVLAGDLLSPPRLPSRLLQGESRSLTALLTPNIRCASARQTGDVLQTSKHYSKRLLWKVTTT
jgi:hypothetical protein